VADGTAELAKSADTQETPLTGRQQRDATANPGKLSGDKITS